METQHQSTSPFPPSGSEQVSREPLIIEKRSSEQFTGDRPKFPAFKDFAARVASLRSGIVGEGQTAEGLADAGWFHVGPNDKVCCFQCGGNLSVWETGEDPWEEHARWFDCPYIKFNWPSSRPRDLRPSTPARYPIEPREVTARMDTPTARAIFDMGYSPDSVRAVIETRLSTKGDDFPNAEKLIKAVIMQEQSVPSTVANYLPFGDDDDTVDGPYAMGFGSRGLSLELTMASTESSETLDALHLRMPNDFECFGIQIREENREHSTDDAEDIELMPSTSDVFTDEETYAALPFPNQVGDN